VEIGIVGINAKGGYVTTSPNHEARMYDLLNNTGNWNKGAYKPTRGKATWKLKASMLKRMRELADTAEAERKAQAAATEAETAPVETPTE